jgi:hypothetical protein
MQERPCADVRASTAPTDVESGYAFELLEADVDAPYVRVLEKILVSEVTALVIDPEPSRYTVPTPGHGQADDVVGVNERVRAPALQNELGHHARLEADLPAAARPLPAQEAELVAEADRPEGHGVAGAVQMRSEDAGEEVWLLGIGHERGEENPPRLSLEGSPRDFIATSAS